MMATKNEALKQVEIASPQLKIFFITKASKTWSNKYKLSEILINIPIFRKILNDLPV